MKLPRLVLSTVLLLAVCVPAFAQDAGTTTTPPKAAKKNIPTFNFDLRTLESDPVLPFDLDFNIRAKVDGNVEKGELQIRRRSEGCTFVEGAKDTIVGRKVTATDPPQLVFDAPMVLPNVNYCFTFRIERSVDDTQAKAFRQKAREIIDHATLSVGLSDLEETERNAVRESIAAAMKTIGGKAVIDEGTAFGANPTRQSKQDFNTSLQKISQANASRTLGAGNYCRRRSATFAEIEKVLAVGTPARVLLDNVAEARKDKKNAALGELIDAETGAALKAITEKPEYEKVLQAEAEPCADIEALSHPDEANAILGDLRRIQAQFKTVEKFTTALIANEEAAKSVKITTKEEKAAAEAAAKSLEKVAKTTGETAGSIRNLAEFLKERETALDESADLVKRHVVDDVNVVATSTSDFVSRHGFYVTMDVGVASAWGIDEVFSYIGMNFYTRPINKEASLQRGEADFFRKRFSATLGLTLQTLVKTGAYKGVLSDRGLVGAIGWRVLDSVKLTAGGVMLKENARNPLVDRTRLAVTPFIAVSIDWDVRNTLKDLGSVFNVP